LAFLGVPPEKRPEVDPKLMKEPPAAITIVHGEEDEIVPPEIARSYVAAHSKARFVPVAGAAHFAVIDPESKAWPVVLQELERLAKP
jgi:pimeloyl-ACP methyl ester carboxylesterase